MPVGQMLREMSSHEIMEWGVYFKLQAAEQAQTAGTTSGFDSGQTVQTMRGAVTVD